MSARIKWTDELDDACDTLLADGNNAAEIARKLFKDLALRNAVIGRMHRRGIAFRVVLKKEPRPPKAEVIVLRPIIHEAVKPSNMREVHCRWPIGDPRSPDFAFCGAEIIPTKPYCREHFRRAFVKAPKREPGTVPVCVQVQASVVMT